MRDAQKGFMSLWIFGWLIFLVGGVGWILNIEKIAGSSFDPLTGIVVLRCVGVFLAPLGAVLGFF